MDLRKLGFESRPVRRSSTKTIVERSGPVNEFVEICWFELGTREFVLEIIGQFFNGLVDQNFVIARPTKDGCKTLKFDEEGIGTRSLSESAEASSGGALLVSSTPCSPDVSKERGVIRKDQGLRLLGDIRLEG